MRTFLKITAFMLIIIGTVGLLLNEFVWDAGTNRTIIFAVVSLVGFTNLAFARFAMKDRAV